jgi:hypothetical protein
MRVYAAVLVSLSMLLTPIAAAAEEDAVKVRFNSGYPPPDRSSEFIELNVLRSGAATPSRDVSIDQYFAVVSNIVTENNLPEEWGVPAIDAPFVRIDIVLGKRHFTFASTYNATGMILGIDPTENDRRIASALQKVLNLTVEQASSRLSIK